MTPLQETTMNPRTTNPRRAAHAEHLAAGGAAGEAAGEIAATRRAVALAATLLGTAWLAGCVTVKPAELALPAELNGTAPVVIEGIRPGRSGRATLPGLAAAFERGADRLELFERLQIDRAAVAFTVDGENARAECRLRGETFTRGVLNLPLRPSAFTCTLPRAAAAGGAAARLEVAAAAAALQPGQRRGTLVVDGLAVEVQSLHRVAGSPLPLDAPAGWQFSHQGRVVAALELTGRQPRLWRAGGAALDDSLARAALALALLWDPAVTTAP
jgi:hypothetical protein